MTSRNRPDFSLIFPTYNAAGFLEETWQKTERFLWETGGAWEVLFVCDGCSDDTVPCLRRLVRGTAGSVRIVSYAGNRGKGYAIRRGLTEARGRWRVFTDVDLAYSFGDVLRLATVLRSGADIAVASRVHPQSRSLVAPRLRGYARWRGLQSWLFRTLVRGLLGLPQRDTQAGLKGLSARASRLLVPRLRCDGFGFDCELLAACRNLGLPVVELPVQVRYQSAASTVSFQRIRATVRELWQIRRAWTSGAVRTPTEPRGTEDRLKQAELLWTANAT